MASGARPGGRGAPSPRGAASPPPDGRPVDCSVVIVNYATDELLVECLTSLEKTAGTLTLEVIVVDNARTLAAGGFRERFPRAQLIENAENVGFGCASNQGIRIARGRYVLCLNPDTALHKGALQAMIRYLEAHPGAGAVGARLLDPDGSLQYSCRRFPGYLTIFFGRYALLTQLLPGNAGSRDYLYLDWDHEDTREVDWVSGACLMVRREVLDRVGGFDEDYFLFVEDMDWCLRIRDGGFTIAYVAEAVVTHHIGASRAAAPPWVVMARHRGMMRYVTKHVHPSWPVAALIGLGLFGRAGLHIAANALFMALAYTATRLWGWPFWAAAALGLLGVAAGDGLGSRDISGFVLAAGATLALTPVVIAGARRLGALDYPGTHKVHREPVPVLGGLSVAVAVLGTLGALDALGLGITSERAFGLTVAALPVIAVGLWDDFRPRPSLLRLLTHFLAGAILYAFGLRVVELTNPFGSSIPLGHLGLVVTMFWVATVINALNLVDGLDGLAPGIGGIAALSLCAVGALQHERDVAVLGLVLAGAIAGFYPYNFPRARIFLGDAGSTFIGLVLATIALVQNRKSTATMTLLLPLVALGLPVLDTVFAVVRRTARGWSPFRRDMGHLHHRLLRLGLSPPEATGYLLGVSAVFGMVAVVLARLPKQAALSLTVLLGAAVLVALVGLVQLDRRTRNTRR